MTKVLLIAGHGRNVNGSYDPGAVSKWGQEAFYTRELATMIQRRIGVGLAVDMYDQGKNCYSYSKAGQVPNYAAYDAVLEIHFNAKSKKDENGDGKFTGIGAYCHPDNAGGRDIAEKIVAAVVALGFGKWQVSHSTSLHNLNKAQKDGTKYLLLETAFIDDGDDMAWYTANKARVAQAIAKTLINALGGSGNTGSVGGGPESGKPEAGSEVMYRIQTGAFENKDNADAMLIKVKAAGFDTYMVQSEGCYKIQVGAYSVKANADAMLTRVKAAGFDAFITTAGGTAEKFVNPYPVPTRVIRYIQGNIMTGDDVKWVQWELVQAGYNIEIDGKFGPASDAALRTYQETRGLEVDGKCGPATRESIMAA